MSEYEGLDTWQRCVLASVLHNHELSGFEEILDQLRTSQRVQVAAFQLTALSVHLAQCGGPALLRDAHPQPLRAC